MRIKHNAAIAAYANTTADELGIKPSRAGWAVRAEQAERLARLLEAEDRPTTRKAKQGKQAVMGRTRVERARRVEVEEVEMAVDTRPRHWGVVCQTVSGSVYVTTAVVVNHRVDVDTVATAAPTDRVVGVTNWLEDDRFRYLKSMFVGNMDHPDVDKISEVIGYSSDDYLVWYIAK